jgi:TrkA-N domain
MCERQAHVQDAGREMGKVFESKESAALPTDTETSELNNHVIILGFGRVGQTIAQLLSERLIPFVALDVRGDRVAAGQAADLPVYFGDAGSPQARGRSILLCTCAAQPWPLNVLMYAPEAVGEVRVPTLPLCGKRM